MFVGLCGSAQVIDVDEHNPTSWLGAHRGGDCWVVGLDTSHGRGWA